MCPVLHSRSVLFKDNMAEGLPGPNSFTFPVLGRCIVLIFFFFFFSKWNHCLSLSNFSSYLTYPLSTKSREGAAWGGCATLSKRERKVGCKEQHRPGTGTSAALSVWTLIRGDKGLSGLGWPALGSRACPSHAIALSTFPAWTASFL